MRMKEAKNASEKKKNGDEGNPTTRLTYEDEDNKQQACRRLIATSEPAVADFVEGG